MQVWPLILYLLAVIAVLALGLLKRPNRAATAREEALGTGKVGQLILTMTLVATVLGPADTLALADQGKKYGLFFVIFPFCAALQHFVTGQWFAGRINKQSVDCVTLGDIMQKHYNRTAKFLAGLVTVAQALAFTGVLALAGGQVLQAFLGWPVAYGIVATAGFVGIYTTIGGMNAVLRTDRIQFWCLIAMGLTALLSAIILLGGRWSDVNPEWFWRRDVAEFPAQTIASIAIAYFLGEALLPVYAVRGLIAATPQQAASAFRRTGGIIALWYLGMIVIGIAGNLLTGSVSRTDLTFVDVLATLGPSPAIQAVLCGLALAGILALVHSTFDSILNAGASAFARDVVGCWITLSDEAERAFMKRAVIIIALFGTLFSLIKADLIDILLIGYTIWVPTMVLPLAYVLLRGDRANWAWSAVAATAAGVAAYFSWKAWQPIPIPEILVGFVVNAIVLLGAERVFRSRRAA